MLPDPLVMPWPRRRLLTYAALLTNRNRVNDQAPATSLGPSFVTVIV